MQASTVWTEGLIIEAVLTPPRLSLDLSRSADTYRRMHTDNEDQVPKCRSVKMH